MKPRKCNSDNINTTTDHRFNAEKIHGKIVRLIYRFSFSTRTHKA